MTQPAETRAERVLVLTAFVGDAVHTARLLGSAGIAAEVCADAAALCRSIEDGAGAVFLGEEMLAPTAASALLKTLDGQPPWSDLPIVVSVMERELVDAGYGLVGLLGTRANVSLLERPVSTRAVLKAVQGALRARRRQYEARSLIDALGLARARAEESSRAKDEFLATLSHELRTPLNAILGWTHMLQSGALLPEKRQLALRTVERNAVAQTQLIEDLLDVSRALAGKLTLTLRSLDPGAPMQSAVDAVRPIAEAKRIDLLAALDAAAGPVFGDAGRLQQVFWNLLNNAIKFTPSGGRVDVRLARRGMHAEITVRDDGIGIEPSFLPYVFERFRQADSSTTRAYGGLGIGLSIVKNVVELHGGRVAVSSDGRGRGSTFVVTLPLAPGADALLPACSGRSEAHPQPVLDRRSPRLTGLRILVIDDEPEAAELMANVLQSGGATVLVASSASTGYELLVAEHPDILVSDIGMAVEDGYDFIRRVRASESQPQAHIPALAVTAYARVEDRTRALTAGFDMHVAKPIAPGELVGIVETLAKQFREARA